MPSCCHTHVPPADSGSSAHSLRMSQLCSGPLHACCSCASIAHSACSCCRDGLWYTQHTIYQAQDTTQVCDEPFPRTRLQGQRQSEEVGKWGITASRACCCHGMGVGGSGGRAVSRLRIGARGAQCGGSSAGRCRSAATSPYGCTYGLRSTHLLSCCELQGSPGSTKDQMSPGVSDA